MKLTEAQKKAVAHSKGNLQLIACAGSGKTEVVARFVANLLNPTTKPKISPANVIAFTFTEKAAAELKERIVTRCREENGDIPGLAELYVGTIHAFCLDLLKSEVPRFLKYEVLNEVQQALFVDRNSKKSGLTTTTDLKGRTLQRYKDTTLYVSAVSILREAELDDAELRGSSVVTGLRSYRSLLESKDYLDYSSILDEAVTELRDNAGLRDRMRARVRFVIVDEYQDVNPIQECIVKLLHDLGAHLCVVGDDDQTIYQWRGSDVRNILPFAERYPKPKQIRLEENFRIYALGYCELTGRNADYVEIYDLDGRKRKPRSVDDDFIDDVKRDVRRAAEALRKGGLDKKPAKKKCASCDYRMMCSAGATATGGTAR